jgi:hypothetical protein
MKRLGLGWFLRLSDGGTIYLLSSCEPESEHNYQISAWIALATTS